MKPLTKQDVEDINHTLKNHDSTKGYYYTPEALIKLIKVINAGLLDDENAY